MEQRASASSETYQPDALFANDGNIRHTVISLPDGTAALPRGAVLGKKSIGNAVAVAAGSNTGNGIFTLDVATPVLAGAKVGAYTVTCIAAASNSGTFRVENPDGLVMGDVVVGATFADGIKFVIADGSADFVIGDKFTVTIGAGTGLYVLSVASATDGSQIPDAVLGENTPLADGEDIESLAYIGGEFNADNLTFGAGHTADSVRDILRAKGIYIR